MAQVPGAFVQSADVTFDNVVDLVLQVEATPGFAVVDYGVLPAEGGTATGLVGATTYTASIDVDAPGGPVAISTLGSAALTFTALLAVLNAALTGVATAALVGGKLVITSAAATEASAVVVTDGTGSTALFANVKGPNFGLVSIKSTAAALTYVKWSALDVAMQDEWAAKASDLSAGQANKTYASDLVAVTGAGISAVSGLGVAAATYDLTVTVNSVGKSVAVAVGAAETFATFLAKFDVALKAQWPQLSATLGGSAGTVNIIVTTNVPGNVAAAVPSVTAGTVLDLIAALDAATATNPVVALAAAVAAGTAGAEGTVGASSTPALYKTALQTVKSYAGPVMWTLLPPGAFFTRRGVKPAARGNAREVNVYYKAGTGWVDYTTDLAVA